ncbi:MAG: hypothetical protein P4M15_04980 [Alphaproteobacteria bacterium]|nr:hypothetical protein [Alphaproteobacteria bacterium]
MSFSSPASNVGRFTALILGSVVLACLLLIGGTGYLKYQLDRAETLLAAPDTAVGSDQDSFDRLRRDLGYGGFLGLAQNYALAHDTSGFAEMKAQIKSADDIIAHLPDKTPAEMRHDLTAIVSTFDAAFKKLNAPAGDNSEFTASDLTPLYAALPILDARVTAANAATRLIAQGKVQFWGMLITLVSWCSLIIAAACAAGIYLTVRDKHSAPMRALSQSIQNMARGDMRTAIWGTERQDQIGELARAVDIARYHFSHLPDLSLLSDQGPVRMRFEGGTRSLFEAMMKAISRDSETIRDQTVGLNEAVRQQRESISLMSEKVETVLQNILQRGQSGDAQIRNAITEMASSAENLKNAHAHAADQLNRLIPQMQERVQGMAEIAHITGKQVSSTLQALTASEAGLKANTVQAEQTLSKLSSTADGLGERLFGAVNLLQASGKVLAETTENLQTRLNMMNPDAAAASRASIIEPLATRLENVTIELSDMQSRMNSQLAVHSKATEAQITLLNTHSGGLLTQTATTVQTLSTAADHLREGQHAFESALSAIEGKLAALAHNVSAQASMYNSTSVTGSAIQQKLSSLEAYIEKQKHDILDVNGALAIQTRDQITGLTDKISSLQQRIDQTAQVMQATQQEIAKVSATAAQPVTVVIPREVREQMDGQWYQMAAQIEASRNSLEQAIREQMSGKMGSLDQILAAAQQMAEAVAEQARTPAPKADVTPELQRLLKDQWYQMAAQIEASRTSLAQTIGEQISRIEARLAGVPKAANGAHHADPAVQRQMEQQTQILSELVSTLSVLDNHMQQIKSDVRVAGAR